jgi:hypothetical protein
MKSGLMLFIGSVLGWMLCSLRARIELERNFGRLKKLASKLPSGLRSDWQHTNHFELTTADRNSYWWVDLADGMLPHIDNWKTEEGKRRGLMMDVVAEVGRLKDEGVLTPESRGDTIDE